MASGCLTSNIYSLEHFEVCLNVLSSSCFSADHLAKTDKFFWNNLIDKKKKPEFILKQEDFEK